MKNLIPMLLILLSLMMFAWDKLAHADWLCTEESSQRRGNTILACGRGPTPEIAFQDAVAEFKRICDISSDCKYHDVSIAPQRTEVIHRTHNKGTKKKYIRLIAFEILDTSEEKIVANREGSPHEAVLSAFAEELQLYR